MGLRVDTTWFPIIMVEIKMCPLWVTMVAYLHVVLPGQLFSVCEEAKVLPTHIHKTLREKR